jgi:hypothetical protein
VMTRCRLSLPTRPVESVPGGNTHRTSTQRTQWCAGPHFRVDSPLIGEKNSPLLSPLAIENRFMLSRPKRGTEGEKNHHARSERSFCEACQ